MDERALRKELATASTVDDLFDGEAGKARLNALQDACELIDEAAIAHFVWIDVPRDEATTATLLHVLIFSSKRIYHVEFSQANRGFDLYGWPVRGIFSIEMSYDDAEGNATLTLGVTGRDPFIVRPLGVTKRGELLAFTKTLLTKIA